MLWFHHVPDPNEGPPFNVCIQTRGDTTPQSPAAYVAPTGGKVRAVMPGKGWSERPGPGARLWATTDDGGAEPASGGWIGTVSSPRGIAAITEVAPTFEQAFAAAQRFIAQARAKRDGAYGWDEGGANGRCRVLQLDGTPVALEKIV